MRHLCTRYRTGTSGDTHHKLYLAVAPARIGAGPIKMKFVMIKDGSNLLFGKKGIIPETTLKIGYNSIKHKHLNVFNTSKTK